MVVFKSHYHNRGDNINTKINKCYASKIINVIIQKHANKHTYK